jgi:malate dehydrogenase (quinone)
MKNNKNIILIGAGIMSATLGTILKQLDPTIEIQIFERLDSAATESSDAWNNAGTGHSAFCELNYTPQKSNGSINPNKAIQIAEQFEVSKQFWSYLVNNNLIIEPKSFIKQTPHMSFVWGEDNVNFLKTRYNTLKENNLFNDMKFSQDFDTIKSWIPLVMENRDINQKVAATKMELGTDVNFGNLTRSMFDYLKSQDGVEIHFNHEVKKLKNKDGKWIIKVNDLSTNEKRKVNADFVFIGAGGGSLPLLEKSGIPEANGYGGFPVSGQWLRCINEEVIEKHHAKVYGKAEVGAPPMSVPHIDSRIINGKKELLFGPYAGFTTKFLKNGSYWDLFTSIRLNNIIPMIGAGLKNISLTKYLIGQVTQSENDRMNALRQYVPNANSKDWILETAGKRVQVIKKDENGEGILEFGTEVITSADGTIAGLLGASPGASTATSIMLDLVEKCFKSDVPGWKDKLKEMIPSYKQSLNDNKDLCKSVREKTSTSLKIK